MDVDLLFLQLMSQDQEWSAQARSNENTEPECQSIDVFDLERQILRMMHQDMQTKSQSNRLLYNIVWNCCRRKICLKNFLRLRECHRCHGEPVGWIACPHFCFSTIGYGQSFSHRILFNNKKILFSRCENRSLNELLSPEFIFDRYDKYVRTTHAYIHVRMNDYRISDSHIVQEMALVHIPHLFW